MIGEIDTGTDQLSAHVDREGVLRIVLNNPQRHNSLTAKMLAGVLRLFDQASNDSDVRAVLIRGEGDRAFASGADIGEQASRAASNTTNPDRGAYMTRLRRCSKPVLAMVHGYCLGGGLMVAMAADIRIASTDATFSIPAARLGVAYPVSAVHTLVDLVGAAWASDLCLTGDRIDAAKALDIGLVTRVVAKSELETQAEEFVATVASGAPLTHTASKASIAHAVAANRPPIAEAVAAVNAVWSSKDAAEGMKAFFEKRSPKFEGR